MGFLDWAAEKASAVGETVSDAGGYVLDTGGEALEAATNYLDKDDDGSVMDDVLRRGATWGARQIPGLDQEEWEGAGEVGDATGDFLTDFLNFRGEVDPNTSDSDYQDPAEGTLGERMRPEIFDEKGSGVGAAIGYGLGVLGGPVGALVGTALGSQGPNLASKVYGHFAD